MPANSFRIGLPSNAAPVGHRWPAARDRELAETGQITGSVLDVGCGTGENVLYLALDFQPAQPEEDTSLVLVQDPDSQTIANEDDEMIEPAMMNGMNDI